MTRTSYTVEIQQGPIDAPEWWRVAGPYRSGKAADREKARRERSGKTTRPIRVMVKMVISP